MTEFRTTVYRRRPPGGSGATAVVDEPSGPVRPTPRPPTPVRSWLLPTLGASAASIAIVSLLAFTRYPEMQPFAMALPVLFAAVYPLLGFLGRGRSFDLAGIARTGFAIKMAAVGLRYEVIYGEYDGVADADRYHENGADLAASYGQFDFSAPVRRQVPGTGFIDMVLGHVYGHLLVDIILGFVAFGLFAYAGVWLAYRGFELAVPDGRHGRYALLVFLWPTMLFWPSAIGKDAWLVLGIGVTCYGVGRVLATRRFAFPFVALGLWAISQVRPHISMFLVFAFGGAYLLRRGGRFDALGPAGKAVGGVLVGALIMAGLGAATSFFEIDDLSFDSIEEELTATEDRTSKGGSRFEPPSALNPVEFPFAVITVIARPFPFEADSAQMLFTSLEGLVLLGLLGLSLRRILTIPRLLRDRAYVGFASAYCLAFIVGFSSIGNFGILARQRSSLLPLLFVLLCLPALADVKRSRAGGPAPRQR